MPRRGLYDNLRSAVDKVGRGKERTVNARFLAMVSHYLFEAEFCDPSAGWEKGQIEKNVQGARHSLWQGDITDTSADDIATKKAWRSALAETLPKDPVADQRAALFELGVKVQLSEGSIALSFCKSETEKVAIPARLVRRGNDLRLALPAGDETNGEPDPVLLRLVAHARAAQKMVESGVPHPSVAHYGKRHFWQLLRIAWLAPDILAAIVDGRQPADLTGRKLLRATNIPLDWAGQRKVLGFA